MIDDLPEEPNGTSEARATPSSRIAITRLFAEQTDPLTEFNLPEKSRLVLKQALDMPSLLEQFIGDHLYYMIYEIGMAYMTSQRANAARLAEARAAIETVASRVRQARADGGEAAVGEVLDPIVPFNWLNEPVLIARGKMVRLGWATREQLEGAVALMKQRLDPAREKLTYMTLIISHLAPGQTPNERFVNDDMPDVMEQAAAIVVRQDQQTAQLGVRLANGRKVRLPSRPTRVRLPRPPRPRRPRS